jgi:hypothetical protein
MRNQAAQLPDVTRGPPSASRGSRLRGARIWSVAPRLPGVLCHAQSTRSPGYVPGTKVPAAQDLRPGGSTAELPRRSARLGGWLQPGTARASSAASAPAAARVRMVVGAQGASLRAGGSARGRRIGATVIGRLAGPAPGHGGGAGRVQTGLCLVAEVAERTAWLAPGRFGDCPAGSWLAWRWWCELSGVVVDHDQVRVGAEPVQVLHAPVFAGVGLAGPGDDRVAGRWPVPVVSAVLVFADLNSARCCCSTRATSFV